MKVKQLLAVVTTMVIAMMGAAVAEDVTYSATMSGVTWNGCKASVSSAFKSLKGVTTVEVKAGEKAGTQLVIVKGTQKGLKKEDAVKALGEHATRYIVKEWQEGDAKSEKKDN